MTTFEMRKLFTNWWEEFEKKQQDYEGTRNFGVMAQWMKIANKVDKLKRSMYDGEIIRQALEFGLDNESVKEVAVAPYQFESTEEILRDIIGHCFLALKMLEDRKPKPPTSYTEG